MSVPLDRCARAGGMILCVLLVSRLAAEAINTYLWAGANWLWAMAALGCIVFLMWPLLALMAKGNGRLFRDNIPIFAYLLYLLARVHWTHVYSMKCVFVETIVWFCFVFTIECGSRFPEALVWIRSWSVRLVKLLVAIGAIQLLVLVAQTRSLDPHVLLNARPVKGIFFHSSAYMAVVFPFVFFFLKDRAYLWLGLLVLACVATGTRSPMFAAMCLALPAAKSAFRVRITWIDIAITAGVLATAYWSLITWTGTHEVTEDFDSRMSTGSLQWRIAFWQNFLVFDNPDALWFGHGVGSADELATDLGETRALGYMFAPHNDYVRLYYDTGLIGELLFLNLVFSNFRRLMHSRSVGHDYAILMYMLILAFSITDNFVYFLYPLLAYVFIACSIPEPAAGEARSTEPLHGWTALPHVTGS